MIAGEQNKTRYLLSKFSSDRFSSERGGVHFVIACYAFIHVVMEPHREEYLPGRRMSEFFLREKFNSVQTL